MNLRIFVHYPGHHLSVCVNVRGWDIPLRPDFRSKTLDKLTGHSLHLAGGKLGRIDGDSALGTAERNVDQRGLPGHQRSKGANLVGIDRMVKAKPSFHRTARRVVLYTIAREHRQLSVVSFNGHCDVVFALRREEEAFDPITEFHRARRLADVIVSLFERSHRCHGLTSYATNRQAASSEVADARRVESDSDNNPKARRKKLRA
jgi:hypothetical protein